MPITIPPIQRVKLLSFSENVSDRSTCHITVDLLLSVILFHISKLHLEVTHKYAETYTHRKTERARERGTAWSFHFLRASSCHRKIPWLLNTFRSVSAFSMVAYNIQSPDKMTVLISCESPPCKYHAEVCPEFASDLKADACAVPVALFTMHN